MKPSARTRPRYDPKTIYDIHADRDAGMSATEIAAKHDLPAMTVQGFLRSNEKTCALLSPYELRGPTVPPNAAVQLYWLGYIAASGRVFGQNNLSTLVLAIHPDDAAHIQLLLDDLVVGHPRIEFADSSLDGRQAYVRDRALVEVLLQWGIAAAPEEGSIPVELIPPALVPDFVRGYLEGSRNGAPLGGNHRRIRSQTVTLVGHRLLVEGLSRVLKSVCGVSGEVTAVGRLGLVQIAFSPADSARILQQAYRLPARSSPRAAKLVERFGNIEGHERRRRSRAQSRVGNSL